MPFSHFAIDQDLSDTAAGSSQRRRACGLDYVEHESQNEYEREVAICLDHDANVLWWYRNLGGRPVRDSWQQLGGGFKDHVFRFQILDEAQDLGRDWKDQLRDLLRE